MNVLRGILGLKVAEGIGVFNTMNNLREIIGLKVAEGITLQDVFLLGTRMNDLSGSLALRYQSECPYRMPCVPE